MNDFLYARSQMGMSLAFHIIFAALGIGLPVLMAISEAFYLRTRRPVFLELSKRWLRGTALRTAASIERSIASPQCRNWKVSFGNSTSVWISS